MHDQDAARFDWAPDVSADPASPFSVASRAFFVVGLHPRSSRLARRAPQPTLVFNFHDQFETLRASAGDILRVIDPYREQVSDLFAFAADSPRVSLSSGRTIDYESTIYLTSGNSLWSSDSRKMFTILRDDVGRHDFLLTPCSQAMFEILYRHQGHHPSCLENLVKAFQPFGIDPDRISTTFNIFMRVDVSAAGVVAVKPPLSKPGSTLELRAEMDLVCALTACSAENSNNGSFKPIDWHVVSAALLTSAAGRR